MIRAVIFDMFETLITHYKCETYFGSDMARDAGIDVSSFYKSWDPTEYDRSNGKISFEMAVEQVLRDNNKYNEELFEKLVRKRKEVKVRLFDHMHGEIIPTLDELKKMGYKIALISNCFSEEAEAIKKSVLYNYFDVAILSCDEGVQKPDSEIFKMCLDKLNVNGEECFYIGDGGSMELEAAKEFGMKAMQCTWYFNCSERHPGIINDKFKQINSPLEVLKHI